MNIIKKTLLIIGLTGLIFSQEKRSFSFYYGSGFVNANIDGDSSSMVQGDYFGISKNIGILFFNTPFNVGLQFANRGGQQTINLNDFILPGNPPSEERIDFNYEAEFLDLWINATINIGNNSFYLGPVYSMNLSSTMDDLILPAIYDVDVSMFDIIEGNLGLMFGTSWHLFRFVGLSLETYQGLENNDKQRLLSYNLKLSIGL